MVTESELMGMMDELWSTIDPLQPMTIIMPRSTAKQIRHWIKLSDGVRFFASKRRPIVRLRRERWQVVR